MLRNNKLILTLLVLFVFLQLKSFSQAPLWQWINSDGGFSQEGVRQIATDAQGNIYAIAQTYGSVFFDTLPTLPALGVDDFIVISYTCNGDFRWVQQFGSNSQDKPCGIIVNNNGDVYVSGMTRINQYYSAKFGDTTIAATNNLQKSYFLAKLNQSGHTEWISLPGQAINWVSVWPIQMEIAKNNDIVILSFINDSITWNGHSATDRGYHLIKFNPTDGQVKNIIRLDFSAKDLNPQEGIISCFDIDENIYFHSFVNDTIFIGSDTLTADFNSYEHSSVIAKFDMKGNYVWHQEVKGRKTISPSTEPYQFLYPNPIVIGDKVFLSGETQSFANSNFLGIPIHNNIISDSFRVSINCVSFNIKDGSLNNVLLIENKNTVMSRHIEELDDNLIYAFSGGKLVVINQTDTIKPYYNGGSIGGNYPFVVSMDTGLTHFNWGMSTPILQANASASMNDIHIDHNGNIYLGGSLQGSILNSFGDTTHTLGADFYIAKIAYTNDSCGCEKSIPAVGIVSSSGNILTIKASATNDPDSLYIIWGDGDSSLYTQINTNISHTYSTTGPWNICVRAYGYCGIEDTCLNNLYSGLYPKYNDKQLTIKVFPNPFQNSFNIKLNAYVNNTDLRIYDMMGKEVFQTKISGKEANIPSSHLAKGIYLLELTHSDGMRLRVRLIRD